MENQNVAEYQAKKIELTTQLETVNRNIIITEQNIKQQEDMFMQQFGTVDPAELEKLANDYKVAIEANAQKLLQLEGE